jgi:hypothetical protein
MTLFFLNFYSALCYVVVVYQAQILGVPLKKILLGLR